MALVHTIIEIRSYYDAWLVKCDIIDDITNQLYHYIWNFNEEVTAVSPIVIAKINSQKAQIQKEILYQQNDMNLTGDEQIAIEHLRDVKTAIIGEIRDTPEATLAQASAWVESHYPNSVIHFPRLYQWYLNFLGLSTWDEFKEFCINHEFVGID